MQSRDSRWNIIGWQEGDFKQQKNIVIVHCSKPVMAACVAVIFLVMAYHGVIASLFATTTME